MNHKRVFHSSCFLADKIYTFCGYSTDNKDLTSIESFDARAYYNREVNIAWQIVNLSRGNMTKRWHPLVAPINSN